MFINNVITAEFTKSINRHPIIGTTKYGVGANPNLLDPQKPLFLEYKGY